MAANFDLDNFLPYRLHQAAERTSSDFYQQYREKYSLRRTEWRVLFNIGQYGPISATEIAEASGLEKTKISRAVQRLFERGWLRRIHLESDRRKQELELTKSGLKVFHELAKLASTFNQKFEERLGNSAMTQLLQDLRRLD